MRQRLFRFVLMIGCLGLFPLSIGCAQDAGPLDERARAALGSGDYDAARTHYTALLAEAGGLGAPALSLGEAYLQPGAYTDGLAAFEAYLAAAPEDPYLRHVYGRLLHAVGRYAEAEAAFEAVHAQQPTLWPNVLALGGLLEETGRRREAYRYYIPLYRQHQQGTFRTAEDLTAAAQAAARLEEFHEANQTFRLATQVDPQHVEAFYAWAELFRSKYNDADALSTLEEALALNPRRADLYVAMAETVGAFGRKEELAGTALEHNPNSVAARGILAELRILDGLYEEAETVLEEALAINPASVSMLAHLASVHHLRGDTVAFAEVEQRALAVNPRAGGFYLQVAENATNRFRYPDAAVFGQRAIAVERDNVAAYAALGISLLRLGQVRQAQQYLEASFDRDPFNLFVGNTLTLLEEYADFSVLESDHFRLLIHNDERDVLGPQMLAEAEAAYAALGARYPYRPAGKITIEAYNDADDFAVRVAGVPHLGLLGVCFGDVVALQTPRARPGDAYNWARTLWHELAHTMAIGTSDHHVPRWFTEGLSVYEEQQAHPAWGREMQLEFFGALDAGQLLPLRTIDRGFTRPQFPGQVILSYYHAARVIDYLAATYGFAAVIEVLTRLRTGATVPDALAGATGQDIDALDRAFRATLQPERAALADVLAAPDPAADPAAPVRADSPFFDHLRAGNTALQAGRYDEAIRRFDAALALFTGFTGTGNPYLGLAEAYAAQGDTLQQAAALERFLAVAEHAPAAARTLAGLLADSGDTAAAATYFTRSLEVEPYDRDVRERLAVLYEADGRYDRAVVQRQALLGLNPVDRAQAYYDFAAALLADGQVGRAKRAVLQSLELAPGFRAAQKLLLRCVEAS